MLKSCKNYEILSTLLRSSSQSTIAAMAASSIPHLALSSSYFTSSLTPSTSLRGRLASSQALNLSFSRVGQIARSAIANLSSAKSRCVYLPTYHCLFLFLSTCREDRIEFGAQQCMILPLLIRALLLTEDGDNQVLLSGMMRVAKLCEL